MKLIVAGTRTFNDYSLLEKFISKIEWKITEIVSGGAPGADTMAIMYAKENNIPYKLFPALWDKYKKAAGPMRNKQMAEYADALLCFWDGVSPGTKNMIEMAKTYNLKYYIVKY
jgi:hypothetical protein